MAAHSDMASTADHERSQLAKGVQAKQSDAELSRFGPQDPLAQRLQRVADSARGGAGASLLAGKEAALSLQRHHATILGDARLQGPRFAQRRAEVFLQLQRTYGNAHARQVAHLLQEQRAQGTPVQRCSACSAGSGGQASEEKDTVQRSASSEGQGSLDIAAEIGRSRGAGEQLHPTARAKLEPAMGVDLSNVTIHNDSHADSLSRSVQAEAFTTGSDVYFRAGRYDPHSEGGLHLLAHELTHTVQQSKGTVSGTQHSSGVRVSDPADGFEREAEQNADQAMQRVQRMSSASSAALQREPKPEEEAEPALQKMSSAPGSSTLQRVVDTNGGAFDTTTYAAFNSGAGVGKGVGADINVKFTPNSLVEANTIGVTQSVKTLKSTTAGGPVNTPSGASARKNALSLTSGDTGRAIDQGDGGSHIPNTNPLYAVENSPGHVATTLTNVGPDTRFGDHGHRIRQPNGTYDVKDAFLKDGPRRGIEFAGQEWQQSFEVTALVLDGPLANTYLGSVEWGWKNDAAGTAALDPAALKLVRAGAPTSAFMDAARKWNTTTFTDPVTGIVHNTVALPTTTLDSGAAAAKDLSTKDLLARIAQVTTELGTLAAGTDKTNKEFEKRALEAELSNRKAKVDVKVIKTEGRFTADRVYVKLLKGGAKEETASTKLNDGDSNSYLLPLSTMLPLSGPVTVEVWDYNFLSSDSLIVTMGWAAPFDATKNTSSRTRANYDVTVQFER